MHDAQWTIARIDPSLHFRHFFESFSYMNENRHKNRQNEITYLMQNIDNERVSGTVMSIKWTCIMNFLFMQNVYIYEWCRWWYPGCVLNLIQHKFKNISEFNEFSVENISLHSTPTTFMFWILNFLNESKRPFISFDLSTVQFEGLTIFTSSFCVWYN